MLHVLYGARMSAPLVPTLLLMRYYGLTDAVIGRPEGVPMPYKGVVKGHVIAFQQMAVLGQRQQAWEMAAAYSFATVYRVCTVDSA